MSLSDGSWILTLYDPCRISQIPTFRGTTAFVCKGVVRQTPTKTRGCRRLEISTSKEWGLLWRREWTFGFIKKWGVPWLTERLSASQEGIRCKESVRTWLWWRILSEGIERVAVFMCLCLSSDHVGQLAQCTSETNPLKSVPVLEVFYCSVQLFFGFHVARQYFIGGFEIRCYKLCCPECDCYYYHHHYYYRLCCPVRDCQCIEYVVRFVTVSV